MTWRRELGRNHLRLGRSLLASGNPGSFPDLQAAVTTLDAMAASDRTNVSWQRDAAEARHARGEARLTVNDVTGAQADARAATALIDAVLAKNPDDRDASRILRLALMLAGEVQARRGDAAGAGASWQRALTTIEPLATDSSDHRLLEPWTRTLLLLGRPDVAARVLERLDSTGYRNTSLSDAVRGMTPQQLVHAK